LEEVISRLDATVPDATSLPTARNTFGVVGFCWGGSSSFAFAGDHPELSPAAVYYGSRPPHEILVHIHLPIKGFNGRDRARVNQAIPPADETIKRLCKTYRYHLCAGTGHGFLRAQTGLEGSNMETTRQT
jgi:carboxymethylenebutenolidase